MSSRFYQVSFFVHRETYSQKESMVFAVCRCSGLCENFHVGTSDCKNFDHPCLNKNMAMSYLSF